MCKLLSFLKPYKILKVNVIEILGEILKTTITFIMLQYIRNGSKSL